MDDQIEFDMQFEQMREEEDLLMNDAEVEFGDLRDDIGVDDVDVLVDDLNREATESTALPQSQEDRIGRPGASTPHDDDDDDGEPFVRVGEVDELGEGEVENLEDAFHDEPEERPRAPLRGSIVGVSGKPDEFNLSNMNKKAISHEVPAIGGGASGIGGGVSGIGGGASRIGGGATRIGAGFASGLKKPTAQQHEPAPQAQPRVQRPPAPATAPPLDKSGSDVASFKARLQQAK